MENRPEDRPDSGSPGAWLFAGDTAVVHLNFHSADREGIEPGKTGAFNHVAFEASDFDATCDALNERGLEYRTSQRPEIKLSQIFLRDPNGIQVELNIRG